MASKKSGPLRSGVVTRLAKAVCSTAYSIIGRKLVCNYCGAICALTASGSTKHKPSCDLRFAQRLLDLQHKLHSAEKGAP